MNLELNRSIATFRSVNNPVTYLISHLMRLVFTSLLFLSFSILIAQGPACRQEARIDEVYSTFGLSGEGVLTVMLDRGIDYRHPDFIDENGNTRIAYIFDPYDDTGANDPDNPYGTGTIYDEGEINASLQAGGDPLVNDIFGHGTATTGIMCGNGSAIPDNELYRGVAYKSKIISVIVTRDFVPPFGTNPGQPGQFNPAVIPLGLQFAADKIEECCRVVYKRSNDCPPRSPSCPGQLHQRHGICHPASMCDELQQKVLE